MNARVCSIKEAAKRRGIEKPTRRKRGRPANA
jgi:hypothetical protein